MKFGLLLQSHLIAEWRQFYLDYERLKDIISSYCGDDIDEEEQESCWSKLCKICPMMFDEVDEELLNMHDEVRFRSNTVMEPYRFAVNFDAQSMSQNVYGTASNPVLDHVSFPVVHVGPQTSEWEIKETWRNCILSEVKKVNTFYQGLERQLMKEYHGLEERFSSEFSQHSLAKLPHYSPMTNGDNMFNLPTQAFSSGANKHLLKLGLILLYQRCIALSNFVGLNHIGFNKILKKFDKNANSKMKSDLMSIVNDCRFVKSKEIAKLTDNIVKIYANAFERSDEVRGKVKLLENIKVTEGQKEGYFWLGLKMGMNVVLGIWTLYSYETLHRGLPHHSLYVFRGILCLISFGWFWGFDVWVWSKYRINYVFIFEFDPRSRLTYYEIWSESASWTTIYLVCTLIYLKSCHYIGDRYLIVIPAALYSFFILRLFCPLIFPYWETRACLLANLWQTIIAPFGLVRFRHFYTGDVLTSLVKVLADFYMATCLLVTGEFNFAKDTGSCHNSKPVGIPVIICLPYWFRLMQCLNQVWKTGERFPYRSSTGRLSPARKCMLNAIKYFLCLMVTLIGALHGSFGHLTTVYEDWNAYRLFWIAMMIISTLYSYSWDVFMDWNLSFDSFREPRPKGRMMYHFSWYYFAVFFDLILRFFWCFTLLPFDVNPYFISHDDIAFVYFVAIAELARRAMWGIFRVENAHESNTDEFRKYNYVPVLFDNEGALERKKFNGMETGVVVELGSMVMVVIIVICIVVLT